MKAQDCMFTCYICFQQIFMKQLECGQKGQKRCEQLTTMQPLWIFPNKKITDSPGQCGSVGWSVVLFTKRSWVPSPVRALRGGKTTS